MINGTTLNFEIINFQFLDGDVPCSPSYGVYISQLSRFAAKGANKGHVLHV